MIIVIIIFIFLLCRVCQSSRVVFKPKGYENRPKRLSLHPSRGSAGHALGGLYTLGSQVCRPQAHGAVDPLTLGLQPRARDCPWRPRLGKPRQVSASWGRGQASRPAPTPWLGNSSVRCPLPRGSADLRLAGCRPQARGSAHPGSRAANPLALGLQPSERVCAQGWADLAPSVCMLGPRPAPAPRGCSLGNGQVLVACPTPKPSKTFSIVRLYLDSLYIHSANT